MLNVCAKNFCITVNRIINHRESSPNGVNALNKIKCKNIKIWSLHIIISKYISHQNQLQKD